LSSRGSFASKWAELVQLPFTLPKIDLNMQWHERVHRDPGGKWLREAFASRYRAMKPT
jgi:hypothetical protein